MRSEKSRQSSVRSQFLEKWLPYPKVSASCRSVSSWKALAAGGALLQEQLYEVGGLLRFPEKSVEGVGRKNFLGDLTLTSQEEVIKFQAREGELDGGIQGESLGSHLASGDRVLIRFYGRHWCSERERVEELEGIQLLAPRLSPDKKSGLALCERARSWQDYLSALRLFFRQRSFVEVDTPSLVSCPGMEVELEPFSTLYWRGRKRERLFLPTSPEIHLKKLLVRGWSEIFEIKKCYRNGELSDIHEPEFWMLEWYRAYSDLSTIWRDVQDLVEWLFQQGLAQGERPLFKKTSIQELFLNHLGFRLTPQTSRQELVELADRKGVFIEPNDSWNDLFHRLFLEKIEPFFQREVCVMVYHYPPSQSALARLTEEGWADRFEVYWRGLELGNAFHELNDPVEQRRRWNAEARLRSQRGKTEVPLDQDFLEALEQGLPPSGGIAIGVERLYMAAQNLEKIAQTKLFSHGTRLSREL